MGDNPDDLQVEFKSRPRVKGEFTMEDGSSYVGEYVREAGRKLREGSGRFQYADGSDYTGSWKDDKMHGKGMYKFSSGDEYEGSFTNGLFSGFGVYRFPDGSLYEGEWQDNMMHGAGYYLDKYQRRFEGEFLYGTFNSTTAYASHSPPELPGQTANETLIQAKLMNMDINTDGRETDDANGILEAAPVEGAQE